MKKIALMGALALCLGFASCDGYEEPNPPAQSNPQDAVLVANGLSFTASEAVTGQTVSLEQYSTEGNNIEFANVDFTEPFPADYNLKVVMQMSKTEDFSKPREVSTEVIAGVVTVTPDAVQDAYVALMGKAPDAQDVWVRYAAYAVNGSTEARIGSPELFYGPFKVNILPIPLDLVIEENYYLLGTVNGWSVKDAIKFDHSGGSVYDNPIFTVVVDITPAQAEDGWWWKVIPQSTFETGNWVDAANSSYGPEENGSEDMEGILAPSAINADGSYKDAGAGCLYEYGTYMLTINMIEGTYSFTLAIPHLYIMGDAAGWNWSSPLVAEMQTSDYTNYYAFARLSTGGYKFTSDKDWGATFNLGADGTPEIDAKHNVVGKLLNGSNDNISPNETGLYWNHVNLPGLSFESFYISTLGLIGDCTPNGWDGSTALTPSADGLVWEGDIEFKATGEFKIRANDAWEISLGGDMNNLDWNNAPNIPTPGAGVKHVVLNLSAYPYTITIK